jgi:UDP-3-O-[3-hydroxymyristoyl] N-acetylglucosamine deacetylase/3-hydroxyacyl-[acyl-carrier-protein] dehydratase
VVLPGDQLRLEVISHRVKPNAAVVSGTARVGDAMAAEARIRFVLIDAERACRGSHGGVVDQPISADGG